MRIGPLDLHKTLGADGLVTATRPIQVRRVEEEADGALGRVAVQESFDGPTIDVYRLRKVNLLRGHVILRVILGQAGQRGQRLRPRPERRRAWDDQRGR